MKGWRSQKSLERKTSAEQNGATANTTATTTQSFVPNKLGYAKDEIQKRQETRRHVKGIRQKEITVQTG
jgi:hypothetical protein